MEFQVRALKSADFLIEESLKGDIAAERIELSFEYGACGDYFLGFEPGYRLILMLGQADEDGRYRAPSSDERFVLGRAEETYRDLPLYQYIAGLGTSGVAPIRVEFDAPEVIQADSTLNIELQVDNDLEGPLQVRINTLRGSEIKHPPCPEPRRPQYDTGRSPAAPACHCHPARPSEPGKRIPLSKVAISS